jgi:hypothetical protein
LAGLDLITRDIPDGECQQLGRLVSRRVEAVLLPTALIEPVIKAAETHLDLGWRIRSGREQLRAVQVGSQCQSVEVIAMRHRDGCRFALVHVIRNGSIRTP